MTPPPDTATPPRASAVLIPLTQIEGRLTVLFTVRRADLKVHGGEVSFPGGAVEAGDTSCVATALRETQEEIQLAPQCVEVLGELTPLYIPPTHYRVHPVIGWIPRLPPLTPNRCEVDHILQVPLAHLLDRETVRRERWALEDRTVTVPYFQADGWPIWGATAMILNELLVLTNWILKA